MAQRSGGTLLSLIGVLGPSSRKPAITCIYMEIRAHNPHFPHTGELAVRTEVFKIVRHAQLMQRWRRAAHQVGRLSLFFMRTFEEVHYRPEHAGRRQAG